MEQFLAIFLSLVTVWLAGSMIAAARSGRVDLFSVRNFFLLGFIVFQLTSATLTLLTGYYDAVQCQDYAKTGTIYTILALLFLFLYLLFYRKGGWATRTACRIGGRYGQIGTGSTLLLATLFMIGSLLFRLVLSQIPVFGVLSMIIASGLAAAAAGLAAWAWAPRWTNPAITLWALLIIGTSLATVFAGDFGRRNALDILLACMWGAHHGHWKRVGLKRARTQILTVAGGAMVFMAAFTAGRKDSTLDRNMSLTESFSRLGDGDLGKGFLDMATGQAAAACSMWIIETRPDPFEYDTFHTVRYFLFHPIPRILWENKPIGLGSAMTEQARVRGRSKEFSFGPGLVGHIVNDNPWVSLVTYAFGFAFMMKFMDELVRRHPYNAFIVIPLGVALGDIVGIPRGEAGFFLARIFIMTTSAWIGMGVFGAIAKSLGVVMPPPEEALPPVGPVAHDHDGQEAPPLIDPEYASYGEDPGAERAA